jgi:IS1 family transposase
MAKTTGRECYRTLDEEAKELEVDVEGTDAWAVYGWSPNSDLLETVEQLQTDEVEVADKT